MEFLKSRNHDDEDEQFTCKKGLAKAYSLFRSVFLKNDRASNDKYLLKVLRNRAWILHSCYNANRVINWVTGRIGFLNKSHSCFAKHELEVDIDKCVPYTYN